MPDDPDKRGPQDRARISEQEHEQRYAPKRKDGATKKTVTRKSK